MGSAISSIDVVQTGSSDNGDSGLLTSMAFASVAAHTSSVLAPLVLAVPTFVAAERYGRKLAKKEIEDHLLLGQVCENIRAAYESGCVCLYSIPGVEAEHSNVNDPVIAPPRRIPMFYHAKVEGNRFSIRQEQLFGFVLDNGGEVMGAEDLVKCLRVALCDTMPLIECSCVGKLSMEGKTQAFSMADESMTNMKPGDIKLRMRFDEDFNVYVQDPKGYIDKLKCLILQAVGLDPQHLPNAKGQIRVVDLRKGSIEVYVVVSVGILVGAAIVGLLYGYSDDSDRKKKDSKGKDHGATKQNNCGSSANKKKGANDKGNGATEQKNSGPSANMKNGANDKNDGATEQNIRSRETKLTVLVPPRVGRSSTESTEPLLQRQNLANHLPLSVPRSSTESMHLMQEPLLQGQALANHSEIVNINHFFTRRPVSNITYINHPGDDGWEIVGEFEHPNQCWPKDALFQVSADCYKTAASLCEGDTVLSALKDQEKLKVVFKEIHEGAKRKFVTLRTTQAELTITDNHRVVVVGADGNYTTALAGSLKIKDKVLCGAKTHDLTKILPMSSRHGVVELGFDPDDPVASFNALRWGILTKGRRSSLSTSAFRADFGPFATSKMLEPKEDARSRSCPPTFGEIFRA